MRGPHCDSYLAIIVIIIMITPPLPPVARAQNGAEALAMMVRKGGGDLVSGSRDPEGVTKALLDAAAR